MNEPTSSERAGTAPTFRIVGASAIADIIAADLSKCIEVVRSAYLAHAAGHSSLPHSTFLRFRDPADARIIALPAHLDAPWAVSGVKWISSFPGNVDHGMPRASAVLILNEHDTGHPIVCMEGSIISAARTAASAALAARALVPEPGVAKTLAIIGAGLIARTVHRFLCGTGWRIPRVLVNDLRGDRAHALARRLSATASHESVEVVPGAADAIRHADLVLLATVAPSPHLLDPALFAHCPTVLHLSLRDLSPGIVSGSINIVDDVEHVMRAGTSLELAERLTGSRTFISATLADMLRGGNELARDRPVIFSPFGLGVLDIALGKWVYDEAVRRHAAHVVEEFFGDFEW